MQTAYSDQLPFPSITLCPWYINQTTYRVRTWRIILILIDLLNLQNFSEAIKGQPKIENLVIDIKQNMGDKV